MAITIEEGKTYTQTIIELWPDISRASTTIHDISGNAGGKWLLSGTNYDQIIEPSSELLVIEDIQKEDTKNKVDDLKIVLRGAQGYSSGSGYIKLTSRKPILLTSKVQWTQDIILVPATREPDTPDTPDTPDEDYPPEEDVEPTPNMYELVFNSGEELNLENQRWSIEVAENVALGNIVINHFKTTPEFPNGDAYVDNNREEDEKYRWIRENYDASTRTFQFSPKECIVGPESAGQIQVMDTVNMVEIGHISWIIRKYDDRDKVAELMEGPLCYLEYTYPARDTDNAGEFRFEAQGEPRPKWVMSQYITKRVYLETVQSVTRAYNATLADAGVMIYPSRNRFVMDLGVQETIRITLKRNSRPAPQNVPTGLETLYCTNDKWMKEFKLMMDRWQNYNRSANGEYMTGGMRFYYRPICSACSGEENGKSRPLDTYPVLERNVFFRGNAQFRAGFTLDLTFELVVARMDITSGARTYVTYGRSYGREQVYADAFVKTYMPNEKKYKFPLIPESWGAEKNVWEQSVKINGTTLSGTLDAGAEYDADQELGHIGDMTYKVGDMIRVGGATLVARISDPGTNAIIDCLSGEYTNSGKEIYALEPGVEHVYEDLSGGTYKLYMVGGGGGARSIITKQLPPDGGIHTSTSVTQCIGTPGAGGEVVRKTITIPNKARVILKIGRGGKAENASGSYAANGEPTKLTIIEEDRTVTEIVAKGGRGGSQGIIEYEGNMPKQVFNPEGSDELYTSINAPSTIPYAVNSNSRTQKIMAANPGGCATPKHIRSDVYQCGGYMITQYEKELAGYKGNIGDTNYGSGKNGKLGGGAGISGANAGNGDGGDGQFYMERVY